jgi:hypothetical protein
MNEQLRVIENLRRELIVLPPSAPERSRLKVLDRVVFVEEGGSAGVLIYYDDIRTKPDIDYGLTDLASVKWPWIAVCSTRMIRRLKACSS